MRCAPNSRNCEKPCLFPKGLKSPHSISRSAQSVLNKRNLGLYQGRCSAWLPLVHFIVGLSVLHKSGLHKLNSVFVTLRLYLALASLADPWAFVVSHWSMIKVSHPLAGFISELRDFGHLFKIDLFYAVGVEVIIGVKSRREEYYRYPLRRVAVMIASIVNLLEVGGIVHLEVQF